METIDIFSYTNDNNSYIGPVSVYCETIGTNTILWLVCHPSIMDVIVSMVYHYSNYLQYLIVFDIYTIVY